VAKTRLEEEERDRRLAAIDRLLVEIEVAQMLVAIELAEIRAGDQSHE
jgi:hypothetical protein